MDTSFPYAAHLNLKSDDYRAASVTLFETSQFHLAALVSALQAEPVDFETVGRALGEMLNAQDAAIKAAYHYAGIVECHGSG